jgi:thiamine-monophosphate kinase
MAGADEFEVIARLLRPLAENAPEALNLADDAAVVPSRPGFDVVVTKDALVEGVHFLASDPLDSVAKKLLRVNLSDLAAMGAQPYACLLACAWPQSRGWDDREAFARGLGADLAEFGLKLIGGDTVATTGPMVFSATMLGWVKAGAAVTRAGAKAGDLVQVSGPVGDGLLGLLAAKGELGGLADADAAALVDHYRTPRPRTDVGLSGASAAADISDGLIADAGHIAAASKAALNIELSAMPLSPAGRAWLSGQPDRAGALTALAAGGDDYQLLACSPAPLPGFTVIGSVGEGQGVNVTCDGVAVSPARTGYRHGNED